MTEYSIVFLICHVLRTYTLLKFMRIFFENNQINSRLEKIAYPAYYFVIAAACILIGTTFINITTNLLSMLLLTFCYEAKPAKRVLATIFTFAMFTIVEFLAFSGIQFLPQAINANQTLVKTIAQVVVTSISFLLSLILTNVFSKKITGEVSLTRWIATISIPTVTILVTLLPLVTKLKIEFTLLVIIVSALFFVNIVVFYLYDELSKSAQDKLEKELALQQNTAFVQQLNLMHQSEENISLFRHDMQNHLNALRHYIWDNNRESALSYIDNAFDTIENKHEHCKSGNYAIDSIINFKTEQAVAQEITVKIDVKVPTNLNVEAFDLNIIIGNLLDNAMAGAKNSDKKEISVKIKYECEVLIIDVSNSYNGDVKVKDGKLITTKISGLHGLGIPSTRRIIEKYNGEMLFDYCKEIFSVNAIIFKDIVQKS